MALKQEEKYLDIFNLFTIEKHSRSLFYDWDLGYTAKVGFLYVKNNNIFVNYKLMTSWNLNGITDALKTFDDFRLLFSLVNHEKKQGYFFLSKKNHMFDSLWSVLFVSISNGFNVQKYQFIYEDQSLRYFFLENS